MRRKQAFVRTALTFDSKLRNRYEEAYRCLSHRDEKEVRDRRHRLEQKLTCFRRLSLMHQSQEHASNPSATSLIRLVPEITCSGAVDSLLSALSLVSDTNARTADVDLVSLWHEVCQRLHTVSLQLHRLTFQKLDTELTRLAVQAGDGDWGVRRDRLKRLLLLAEKRLQTAEERMCEFLHSIQKRKGCWIREVTALLSEATSASCRRKVAALSFAKAPFHRCQVDFKHADRVLDSLLIDSSLTAEDDLDLHLRLLEQKIRAD